MIPEYQMHRVLGRALESGGDFAELFFEDRNETNIRYSDSAVQNVTGITMYGAGLHLLSDIEDVYVYTNSISEQALLKLATIAAELLATKTSCRRPALPEMKLQPVRNPNSVEVYPSDVSRGQKIRLLEEAYKAGRNTGIRIPRLAVDYFDTDQQIIVANSEGLCTGERRVTSRLRLQVTVEDGGRSFFNWEDYTRPCGFEAFREEGISAAFAQDVVRRTRDAMNAGTVPSCVVPVVLEAGSCGTLWHESCGHALEASAIAARSSAFVDRIGTHVASPKVTLIDDGTIMGLYGSSGIDDEGQPRRRNVLIENGILRQYMCDRFHGRLIGMASNGCGRRQNYTYAPTSRMSNTFLAPGDDDDEEMLRSVPEGLYVRRIGGGTGGMQFSLEVKEGFWIKNGQLDHQVRGLMLTGNGIDVIKKIDRVGRALLHERNGGFCGAASGLIPTTTSQPRVRISELAIGGEG
jgi:TldD protein